MLHDLQTPCHAVPTLCPVQTPNHTTSHPMREKCLSCLYTDSSCCAKVRFENLTQWQLLVPRHVPKETGPVRPVVLKVFGKP